VVAATLYGLNDAGLEAFVTARELEPDFNLGLLADFTEHGLAERKNEVAGLFSRAAYGPDHERGVREYLGTAARLARQGRRDEAGLFLDPAQEQACTAGQRRAGAQARKAEQEREQQRDPATAGAASLLFPRKATAGKSITPERAGAKPDAAIAVSQPEAGSGRTWTAEVAPAPGALHAPPLAIEGPRAPALALPGLPELEPGS